MSDAHRSHAGIHNHVLSALLLGCMLAGACASAAAMSEIPAAAATGVAFASGGIGDESQAQLNARAGEFNLKLVFALKTGEFLADVKVRIADSHGRTVLDTTAEGPWLFARLPAGTYTIVSANGGKPVSQTVTLAGNGLRTLDFRW